MTDTSSPPTIDIEGLGLDEGALLLIRRALDKCAPGGELRVRGHAPGWATHLAAWCRSQGHALNLDEQGDGQLQARVTRSTQADGRWLGAQTTGHANLANGALPAMQAPSAWGLSARGATVEAGSPPFEFTLNRRDELWAATAADELARSSSRIDSSWRSRRKS